MVTEFLILAAGLGLLFLTGDLLVRGAVGFARRLHIPPLLIGLTIVAFGTSAPELVISLLAVFKNPEAATIAVGNVVGSNIANVFLVLGVPALIVPAVCDAPAVKRNVFAMLGATAVFIGLCWDGMVTWTEGAALVLLLIAFLAWAGLSAHQARKSGESTLPPEADIDVTKVPMHLWGAMGLMLVGGAGLPAGAYLVVSSAETIAAGFGVSPAIIGLTVIAIGTSLPELATTLTATLRNHSAIAFGNILGSNIFNILAILGISAVAAPRPVPVDPRILSFDIWVMTAAALAIVPLALTRGRLNRPVALGFVLIYGGYLALLVRDSLVA